MKRLAALARACRRQSGAALLLATMVMVLIVSVAAIVATGQSGSQLRDTGFGNDQAEALFLAETGLERALKRFSGGTACGSLAETGIKIDPTSNGEFDISAGAATGFSGSPLSATRCRVMATGRIVRSAMSPHRNVSRSIQTIVDKNLVGSGVNPDFNSPETGQPTGWIGGAFAEFDGFDDIGGKEPNSSNSQCNRAAWVVKRPNGSGTASSSANQTLDFTVTPSKTTQITISFDYRVNTAGMAPNEGQITFSLMDDLGNVFTSNTLNSGNTTTPVVDIPNAPATDPPPNNFHKVSPNGCATGYVTGSVTITVSSGSGHIVQITYTLFARAGLKKEIWMDNIVLEVTGGGGGGATGAARVTEWRDCSNTSCP